MGDHYPELDGALSVYRVPCSNICFLDSVYLLDITSWIGQMACKIHQGLVPLLAKIP